ncbi:unnamed protein product [Phytomonas sp. EM1]|nr:unnamed protein product [Phytomonas sp. EM1]|eukprot:CCW64002.1 unnamed protein product [Phytomonas sp. isolate EM1]
MQNPVILNEPIAEDSSKCPRENGSRQLAHESLKVSLPISGAVLNQASTTVDNCSNRKDDAGSNVRSDPLRFVVLVLFSLLSVSNAMQWIAFSSIVDEVRAYFHMSASEVNMLPSVYVIAYISIVFLSCKLYEIAGIKITLVIASLTNAVGAGIKIIALYAWPHPALLFASQAVNSITEVLVIATPPLIANRWFPRRERGVANTIMSSAMNIGSGVGVLVPTFFVGPQHSSKRDFANFFWFNFVICGVTLGLVTFLIPKRPRYAASFTAQILQAKEDARLRWRRASRPGEDENTAPAPAREGEAEREGREEPGIERKGGPHAMEALEADSNSSLDEMETDKVNPVNVFSVLVDCYRVCRRNTSLVLLIVMSAAELGLVWSMATVLPQVFKPYGISEAMTGWISFLNLVLGTAVCPFLMPLVERFNCRYKLILSSTALVLTVDLTLMTLLVHFGKQYGGSYYTAVMFACWSVIAGICQNFTMPLMFEYVVELTFPMAESTSAPMLMWSACAMNLILTLVFGAVLTDDPDKGKSLIIFISSIVITFIGALSILLTKPQHKRQNYETRKFLEQDRLLNRNENEGISA